jgi:hypothetical protein
METCEYITFWFSKNQQLTQIFEEHLMLFSKQVKIGMATLTMKIIKQVELSMGIFKEKTHKFKKALFLFDNAMTHQKWASDAPSAGKMLKGPKLSWTPCPGGPEMQDTMLPDGSIQSF